MYVKLMHATLWLSPLDKLPTLNFPLFSLTGKWRPLEQLSWTRNRNTIGMTKPTHQPMYLWPSGEKILPLCPHHLPDRPAQERSELLSHLHCYIMRSFCYRRQDSPNQYREVAIIDLQRKCRASWVENMWGKIFISVWKSYCLCYVMLKQLVKILPIVSGNSNDIAPKMTMF